MPFCENLMSVIIICLFMTTLGLKKGMSLSKHRAKRFTQVSLHFWFVLTPLCQNYLTCYHTSTHNLFTTSSECIIRTTAIHWVNLTSIDCCFVVWNSIRIPEKYVITNIRTNKEYVFINFEMNMVKPILT